MNAFSLLERKSLRLVDIIDFKWLMARDGVHVHVERLQTDHAYAVAVLAAAAASPRDAVRAAALRLRTLLELDVVVPPAEGPL